MEDRKTGYLLWALAAASVALVIYASLVPLTYTPLSWDETWLRFQEIPWLDLRDLSRRADWVANGLIMIPVGFFCFGALAWKRLWWISAIGLILSATLVVGLVGAIEYLQIWFPPRVLSQNDMAAGLVGGLTGIALWQLAGPRLVDLSTGFFRAQPGFARFLWLGQACAAALLAYALLPFDVILSADEWVRKVELDRVNWVPLADWQGPKDAAKSMLLGSWALPLAVVLSQQFGIRRAMFRVLLWCTAIELASLPIFSRSTSMTDIVVPAAIGIVGTISGPWLVKLLQRLDHPFSWWFAASGWSAIALIGFTIRYERIVTDAEEWQNRFAGILVVPFARAHRSTEFEAAENILIKLIVFALLAFLLAGWTNRCRGGRARVSGFIAKVVALIAAVWLISLAIAIELAQVFLYPLVPDVTDFILYSLGTSVGIIGYRMLIPGPNQAVKPG